MNRTAFTAAAAAVAMCFVSGCSAFSAPPATEMIFVMDTVTEITLSDGNVAEISALLNSLDREFSMYDGKLAELNGQECEKTEISEDLGRVISESIELSGKYGDETDITAGAVTALWNVSSGSPYVPTAEEAKKAAESTGYDKISVERTDSGYFLTKPKNVLIDLGATGKGYACDRVYDFLRGTDVEYGIVSLGSSSLLYGAKPDGKPFYTEIRNPDDGKPLGTVATGQCFVSTSGGYERFFEADGQKYIHIFDTKTGYPAETDLTSVTVFSEENGLLTDFMATEIFIGGTQKLGKYLNNPEFTVIAADKDKKLYVSDRLNFSLNPDSGFEMGRLNE